jgi:hypothetical protein
MTPESQFHGSSYLCSTISRCDATGLLGLSLQTTGAAARLFQSDKSGGEVQCETTLALCGRSQQCSLPLLVLKLPQGPSLINYHTRAEA